jgi:polyisoprenoid-binding protein YceI
MAFTIGGGLVLVAVLGLAFIYFVLFPTSSPKPLAISASATATPVSTKTPLAGTWKIAAGSVASYRVREKLGFLPAQSDAVGRTSHISGSATVAESKDIVTISRASFVVAVNTLKSNEAMRDQHIRTLGIQSDTYPKATFVLSSPLTLPAAALNGQTMHTSVTGTFNIHGTSRQKTVPLQIRLSASKIQAVGSLTFPWSAFNMTAPSVDGFVNVSGHATMEFELVLARA